MVGTYRLVPERLVVLQHVLDASERLFFAAEREKRLELQIEVGLLRQQRAGGHVAATENVSDLLREQAVVGGGPLTLDHAPDAGADGRRRVDAGGAEQPRHGRPVAGASQAEGALLGVVELMAA